MTNQFEFSYQECLACSNNEKIIEDTDKKLKVECTAYGLEVGSSKVSIYIGCYSFTPKQQEIKMENKWDTVTPGALIGKEVVHKENKWTITGDDRVLNKNEFMPIRIKRFYNMDCTEAECIGVDKISPWIEPEVLEERAQFLYHNSELVILSSEILTKERTNKYCEECGIDLIKWPIGEKFIFKNGVLQE